MFSGSVKHGNTLYVSGKAAQFEGDMKTHTDHVLKELETELTKNGSSMEKVLKEAEPSRYSTLPVEYFNQLARYGSALMNTVLL